MYRTKHKMDVASEKRMRQIYRANQKAKREREAAFAGSSGSSLGGAFAGTGNSDARQISTTARLRRQSYRCSPNPFSAPALRAPVDAALPPPGRGASEGGFERADSDLDFDAAVFR